MTITARQQRREGEAEQELLSGQRWRSYQHEAKEDFAGEAKEKEERKRKKKKERDDAGSREVVEGARC